MAAIPEKYLDLLEQKKAFASLATTMPDGSPQVTPVWFDYKDGILRFATVTFYGPARPGEINGDPVNLAPSRGYDSPFIRSEWNSGLIYIRKGDDTLVLDFRDPKNPVKTIGPPLSPEFPPGVGNARPIVFGANRPQ